MNRSQFIKSLTALTLVGTTMKLSALNKLSASLPNTKKMPVLFLGHGSPMNAIEDNEFVRSFVKLGKEIERPSAILCISAHWETSGTFVTAMEYPKTIHDFGGFPKALFDVEYPSPGSPALAKEVQSIVTTTEVGLDYQWGLDHGSWSVIKHLYPEANVPVVQLSIDKTKSANYHFELAQQLQALRSKGVLIVGSGNMIHNLGLIAWDKINAGSYGFDWAIEANEKMKNLILKGDFQSLVNFKSQGKAFDLAIPTPEHFLPLIYSLALKDGDEEMNLFNDRYVAGSLSMTSLRIGEL